MNATSSRSHTIFQIRAHTDDGVKRVRGLINLVDLAGSERLAKTGATGERVSEAKAINQSLAQVCVVI